MAADLSPTDPRYHDTIIWLAGPLLLGLFFDWALLGVLTMQVYMYLLGFPKDPLFCKLLVYGLYLIDWAQTCSATYDGFQWFVYGWGNISTLYGLYTSYLNVPILSSIIGAVVQIFFGWRIWILSKSHTVFGIIIFLALLQLGAAVAVAFFIISDISDANRSQGLVRAVGIRLGSSALVDTVIAGSFTYFLLKRKERTTGHMNHVLARLIRLTIETGTVTALAAMVDLVFFTSQHNGLHQVTGVILGKLYTNALLALFNHRMTIGTGEVHDPDIQLLRNLRLHPGGSPHELMSRVVVVGPEADIARTLDRIGSESQTYSESHRRVEAEGMEPHK